MPRTFKRRKRDGSIVVTLPDAARAILVHVLDDIASVVAEPPVGDVADRLYPRAYLDPTEESAEQQWQALVHDELVKSRVQAIAATRVELEGSQPIALDEDGATRWLTVLNDARLTLGTILGVTEEEPLVFAPDDPRAAASDVYALLTALQGDLVEVLFGELPATGVDDPF